MFETDCNRMTRTLVTRLVMDGRSVSVSDEDDERLLLPTCDARAIVSCLSNTTSATLSVFGPDNIHLGDISLDLENDDELYGENLNSNDEIEAIMETVWN